MAEDKKPKENVSGAIILAGLVIAMAIVVSMGFNSGGTYIANDPLNVNQTQPINVYVTNNVTGMTNSSLEVCTNTSGTTCNDWCTLDITNGIITSCS